MKIRFEFREVLVSFAKLVENSRHKIFFVAASLEISLRHLTKKGGVRKNVCAANRPIAYDLLFDRADDIARVVEFDVAEFRFIRLEREQRAFKIERAIVENSRQKRSAGKHVIAIVENDRIIVVDVLDAFQTCADRAGQNFRNGFDRGVGKVFPNLFVNPKFVDMFLKYDKSYPDSFFIKDRGRRIYSDFVAQ